MKNSHPVTKDKDDKNVSRVTYKDFLPLGKLTGEETRPRLVPFPESLRVHYPSSTLPLVRPYFQFFRTTTISLLFFVSTLKGEESLVSTQSLWVPLVHVVRILCTPVLSCPRRVSGLDPLRGPHTSRFTLRWNDRSLSVPAPRAAPERSNCYDYLGPRSNSSSDRNVSMSPTLTSLSV